MSLDTRPGTTLGTTAAAPRRSAPAPDSRAATFGRLLGELEAGHGAFDYGPTEGEPALRAELTARLGVAPDELLITSGGMQGLDLVCKLLVGPFVAQGEHAVVDLSPLRRQRLDLARAARRDSRDIVGPCPPTASASPSSRST